jgi:hypothetical protein
MRLWRRNRASAALATLALVGLLAACATEDADPDQENPGGQPPAESAAPGDAEEATLEVMWPAEGETVTVPFEVAVESSAELGAIDDQLHHVHVWFGDTSGQPLIVESDTTTIEDAPSGETTMIVQVHTFDHVPASEQVSVPLTVQGGSEGEDQGDQTNPGYDY